MLYILKLQDSSQLLLEQNIWSIVRLENGGILLFFSCVCARQFLCICHIEIHSSTKCSSSHRSNNVFYLKTLLLKVFKVFSVQKETIKLRLKVNNDWLTLLADANEVEWWWQWLSHSQWRKKFWIGSFEVSFGALWMVRQSNSSIWSNGFFSLMRYSQLFYLNLTTWKNLLLLLLKDIFHFLDDGRLLFC